MDLTVKWQELIENSLFRDMPYKIELNKFGQILMSPASNRHGILQNRIAKAIKNQKRSGVIVNRCSVLTSEGIRVSNVAWLSDEFYAEFGEQTPFPKAPEICVEIKSPGNSKAEMEEKIRLYLEKGALEVWIIDEAAKINFYTPTGKMKTSKLAPNVKL
ncbi:MAG: Uma2 family endonuclease [Acidobacteriota bacterium]|nr:Uma2 family endonuclease [Acidobacteriota bacterium]